MVSVSACIWEGPLSESWDLCGLDLEGFFHQSRGIFGIYMFSVPGSLPWWNTDYTIAIWLKPEFKNQLCAGLWWEYPLRDGKDLKLCSTLCLLTQENLQRTTNRLFTVVVWKKNGKTGIHAFSEIFLSPVARLMNEITCPRCTDYAAWCFFYGQCS